MIDFVSIVQFLTFQLTRGIFGLIGSGLFFLSWVWQTWMSKKAGKSVVDDKFWLLRIVANCFLTVHTIILQDLILTSMNVVAMGIFGYNYYLARKTNGEV